MSVFQRPPESSVVCGQRCGPTALLCVLEQRQALGVPISVVNEGGDSPRGIGRGRCSKLLRVNVRDPLRGTRHELCDAERTHATLGVQVVSALLMNQNAKSGVGALGIAQ